MKKEGSRQLAAIMFADIVGYTSMMENDETLANILRGKFRDSLKSLLNGDEGKIVQFYGDGALLIFQSAMAAVKMAETLQRQFHASPQVPARIGIHQGEITYDAEGAYGSAVNVAARIESLAKTGSVLFSEKIFTEIANSQEVESVDMGAFDLKNVKAPLNLYALKADGLPVPKTDELVSAKASIDKRKNIAVLPFTNMSTDAENEYFSDGITEEILNALSRVDGLKVISRFSSFAFKNTTKSVNEIGKQLGVARILEGSVRKAGNQVRITAQLTNAQDGFQIWSETYDHSLENIFEVQDAISKKIAHKMKEHFEPASSRGETLTSSTNNLEAYKQYLQGLFYSNRLVPSETKKGIPFLKKAIDLDNTFIDAYNVLADVLINQAITGFSDHHEAFKHATYYTETALGIDPYDAEAIANMATIEIFYTWEFHKAAKRIKEAKKRMPSRSKLHLIHTLYHMVMGNLDEAENNLNRALELDPMNIQHHRLMGDIQYFKRDLKAAVSIYDGMLERDPGNSLALEFKAWVTLMFGEPAEALRIFEDLKTQNWTILPANRLACAKAAMGESQLALDYLEEYEPAYAQNNNGSLAVNIATLYRFLGDKEACFHYAAEAVKHRMSIMIFIKPSPLWDPIKDLPGYQRLLEKVLAEVNTNS